MRPVLLEVECVVAQYDPACSLTSGGAYPWTSMASGPDLFVVCKSCGSEVSPYITECPYCGTRLRKRAPKLDRGGTPKPPKASRPRLGPLRRGEIPGIRPDRRPYATYLLLIVPIVLTIVARAGWDGVIDLILGGPLDGDWWRPVTTQFLYGSTGYEVAALAAVAIFGILLERRHGWWAPVVVFLVGGSLGMLLVVGAAEVEAAIEALSDPARLEEAQRTVGANAPGIQRILNEALQAADWFGSAHQAAVLEAAGKPDVDERLTAVRTLIGEETSVSMLIGVAVGYELAHQLMRQED